MRVIRRPQTRFTTKVTVALAIVGCLFGAFLNMAEGEDRIEELLGQMTLEEKVGLLSGGDDLSTLAIERLGIPSLKMTDGPHGVRWDKATCFPTEVSLAASWDFGLVETVGQALGRETLAKGRRMLLGPCLNIHRSPLGGRNFESFSEDPHLASRMAVAYIRGVQSQKVATSTKHFACNNEEADRFFVDTLVDERALREIYLPAFKAAVLEGDTWTIMAAHNKINGSYCWANQPLLTEILKNEWGFRGFVVSDWWGVRETLGPAKAGLDLEMPGPGIYFGKPLLDAVTNGLVGESTIDDKVRRILWSIDQTGLLEGDQSNPSGVSDTAEHRALARKAGSEGIVLLKNERAVLPLTRDTIKTIAVIGPNAAEARLGGGGSSMVEPFYSVSPLDGLRKACGSSIAIQYARGCLLGSALLPVDSQFLIPAGGLPGEHGLRGEYFNTRDLTSSAVVTRVDRQVTFDWKEGPPAPGIPTNDFAVRWTGKLVPPASGAYKLGTRSDDGSRIYIDDKLVLDDWTDHGPQTHACDLVLERNRTYDIRIEYYEGGGSAMLELGWLSPIDSVQAAAQVAATCDVAVLFVGLSNQEEGEGLDRTTLEMPGAQAELIEAVARVNSNTVVVLINGAPVSMDRWLDKVPAVVEAWYPGQEGGNAIADVLFGDVNPAGKLPTTFPKRLEDNPSYGNFPGKDNVVRYDEGIFVGYRHYDKRGIEPLFPFGHGLSYTSFKYANLRIEPAAVPAGEGFRVSFEVTNTGAREGQEVVQLYIHDVESSLERPVKELKGFQKVRLNPGEKMTVAFVLDDTALSFFDPGRKKWVVEPGAFEVLIGSSSRDIRLRDSFDLLVRRTGS